MKSLSVANKRQWPLRAIVALLFVLVMAGCSSGASSDEFSLTGVDWQWESWSDANGINEVPTPADYTLRFNPDGTLGGQADCNTFGGTYTQENGGIQITMGMSTLVACAEGSLGGAYTMLLDQVEAGGPDGTGNLALETAGGATRLIFSNPAAPAAAAGTLAGLPWWGWLLAGLILLGLLWWLVSRNRQSGTMTETEKERAAAAAPPLSPQPIAEVKPVAAPKPVMVEPDDLTKIEGIGPKISSVLIAGGVTTYATLAAASTDELTSILAASGLHGSYGDPTTWPAQAKLAAAGNWAGLKALQDTLKGGRAA